MPRDRRGFYKWLDAEKSLRYYFDKNDPTGRWDGLTCGHDREPGGGGTDIRFTPWAQICSRCLDSLFRRETRFEDFEHHAFDDKQVIEAIKKIRPNSPWLEYLST